MIPWESNYKVEVTIRTHFVLVDYVSPTLVIITYHNITNNLSISYTYHYYYSPLNNLTYRYIKCQALNHSKDYQ